MNRDTFLARFLLTSPVQSKRLVQQGHRQAAVLIALVERPTGLHIILTERALHLRHHPGQISFPGGKYEDADQHLQQTALRETKEEIGINTRLVSIIGQLAPLNTTSGFEVFPFVALIDNNFQFLIDHQEVKSVFEIPLTYLLDNRNFHYQHLLANKERHYTYYIVYQNHFIWGATAQMLKNLQEMLLDKSFSA